MSGPTCLAAQGSQEEAEVVFKEEDEESGPPDLASQQGKTSCKRPASAGAVVTSRTGRPPRVRPPAIIRGYRSLSMVATSFEVYGGPDAPKNYGSNRRTSVAAPSFDPEKIEAMGETEAERKIIPKSDEQRQRLAKAVEHILLFRTLTKQQLSHVIDAMVETPTTPGMKIITQGEEGDNFYVIESGVYDVYIQQNGADTKIGQYEDHGSFGELALMYYTPRAATIVAASNGIVWSLDMETFQKKVLLAAFKQRQKYEAFLKSVPLLKQLTDYERQNVADALKERAYQDGEQIIRQGDAGEEMFIVESGQVKIVRKQTEEDGDDSNEEVELDPVHKGGYFGEVALLTHQPRVASCYAVGETKVCVLDVDAFERLLGPCANVMQRNMDEYQEQLVKLFKKKTDIPDFRVNKK